MTSRPATIKHTENRLQFISSKSVSAVETVIYMALGVLLSLTAAYALFATGRTLWHGLGAGDSTNTVVAVIDQFLVVLLLVEILHTVRISIRSHTLVAEPFLVVGLIATIRRMLVITLDAAKLTSAANWANDGQARFRASMIELALLGGTVVVMVISIHVLRKSEPAYEEQEAKRPDDSVIKTPG